ncbi:hypothetical protein ACRRTK_020850 [Alexandromys fortis]
MSYFVYFIWKPLFKIIIFFFYPKGRLMAHQWSMKSIHQAASPALPTPPCSFSSLESWEFVPTFNWSLLQSPHWRDGASANQSSE